MLAAVLVCTRLLRRSAVSRGSLARWLPTSRTMTTEFRIWGGVYARRYDENTLRRPHMRVGCEGAWFVASLPLSWPGILSNDTMLKKVDLAAPKKPALIWGAVLRVVSSA